jgi:hypothetical protein
MEQAIELFAAINFLILGLSHVFQPRAWAEFFMLLHRHGRPGVFVNGFLSLLTGSLIVGFHNVWTGIPVILTVLGWLFILKAAIVFIAPNLGLRSMARVQLDNSRKFIIPGVIMIAVALALAYSLVGSAVRTTDISARPVSSGELISPLRTRASVSPEGSTERNNQLSAVRTTA